MLELLKFSSKKTGLPPGTAIYVGEKKTDKVRVSVVDYDRENYETFFPEDIKECEQFKQKPTVTWVNIDGLHEAQKIETFGECFGLHPLTIEDILHTTQRPKMDVFDEYVFLVIKMPRLNTETNQIEMEQISFVISGNYLLTFQELEGDTFDAVRNRIKNNKGRIRRMGVDYLAYALMDSVVDHYFAILEQVGEQIELLEEELVVNPSPETLQKIHFLKREMILLRKSVWPLREVISGLQRDEVPQITEAINFFLKDLYDHTIQVIDTVETFRDIISGMVDIYLSSVSNRMNEVMKVLTIFAAIFIPLTFIAGIYGMNFNPEKSPFNMPELNWAYGYPFALGLMLTLGIGMLIYFKIKKWF